MVVSENRVEFARVFEFAKLVNAGKALEFHEKHGFDTYEAISLINDSFIYYEINELGYTNQRKEITFDQMCNLIESKLLDTNIVFHIPHFNHYY